MKELIEQQKVSSNRLSWLAELMTDAKTGELLIEPYIHLKSGLSYDYSTVSELPFLSKLNFIPDIFLTQLLEYYQDHSNAPHTIPWHLFLCPLSHEFFKTPLLADDGKIYEKEALLTYLKINHNRLPNSMRSQNRPLITPTVLTKLIESTQFQAECDWVSVTSYEDKEQKDWHVAHEYFNQKPDGTKLPYAAILDDKSKILRPRPKHPEAFLSKSHNNIHSYIKIEGQIYQIARGRKPNATLGKGAFGKIKFAKNNLGSASVLKIEKKSDPCVINEYDTLKDLKLTAGKIQRQDKLKSYTLMPYLGRPLDHLLDTDPKICNKKPKDSKIGTNSTYLFFNEKRLECVFSDRQGIVSERTISKDELGENYDCISDLLDIAFPYPFDPNFPYKLCQKRPKDDEILKEIVYLYENNGGLRYAFMDNLGQTKRVIVSDSAFSTKPQGFIFKVCEREPVRAEIKARIFYIFKAPQGLMYRFINHYTLISAYIKSNEYFYQQIHLDLNRHLITHPIRDFSLKTALFKSLGFHPEVLDDNRRLEIAIDICLEVAYLHEGYRSKSAKGYAHLDIKPENIVIDSCNKVHLIDFGFAETEPYEVRLFEDRPQGTDVYLPYHEKVLGLSREQYDMLALKRTLFLPLSFYSIDGHETIDTTTQKTFSVLTPKLLDDLKLAPYIDTSSTENDCNYFTNSPINARTLAAILITATLDLTDYYQDIIDNKDLSLFITSCYSQNKTGSAMKALIEERLKHEQYTPNPWKC